MVQRTQAEDEGVGLVVDESEDVTLRDRVLLGVRGGVRVRVRVSNQG